MILLFISLLFKRKVNNDGDYGDSDGRGDGGGVPLCVCVYACVHSCEHSNNVVLHWRNQDTLRIESKGLGMAGTS